MSDRERWIVYPLLFMSLGMSLRDKFGPPVKEVATRRLVVVNEDWKPVVTIEANKDGDGVVRVGRNDQKMELVLGHEGAESSLFVEVPTSAGGARQAVVGNLQRLALLFEPTAPKKPGKGGPSQNGK